MDNKQRDSGKWEEVEKDRVGVWDCESERDVEIDNKYKKKTKKNTDTNGDHRVTFCSVYIILYYTYFSPGEWRKTIYTLCLTSLGSSDPIALIISAWVFIAQGIWLRQGPYVRSRREVYFIS